MENYHFQINQHGVRTPWPLVIHRTRRFKSKARAIDLAIRAADFYKAEVRLSTGKHPTDSRGEFFRSPFVK